MVLIAGQLWPFSVDLGFASLAWILLLILLDEKRWDNRAVPLFAKLRGLITFLRDLLRFWSYATLWPNLLFCGK